MYMHYHAQTKVVISFGFKELHVGCVAQVLAASFSLACAFITET